MRLGLRVRRAVVLAAVLGGGAILVLSLAALVRAAPSSYTPTLYTSGLNANSELSGIAPGPDGAMWFADTGGNLVGRITADGTITEYGQQLPGGAEPEDVVAEGGMIWFTERNGTIGEIDPSTGSLVGQYPLPSAGSEPEGIAVGPDGALWFAESGAHQVGRLDPSAVVNGTSDGITEYSVPGGTLSEAFPQQIVSGPDGALWMTLGAEGGVARLDPAQASPGTSDGVTVYPLPTSGPFVAEPEGIVVGPDRALWVAGGPEGTVARVDPAAVSPGTTDGITSYSAVDSTGSTFAVSDAGDGALWFSFRDPNGGGLLRFDPATDTTTSSVSVAASVFGAAHDASGNLWFTTGSPAEVGTIALATTSTTSTSTSTTTTVIATTTTTATARPTTTSTTTTTSTATPTTTTTTTPTTTTTATTTTTTATPTTTATTTTVTATPTTTTTPVTAATTTPTTTATTTPSTIATTATTTAATSSASSAPGVPQPPTPGQPAITTTFLPGQMLACDADAAGWSGDPSFTYQWLRDGSPIAGATSSDYTIGDEDSGHTLACRVTGTNGAGAASTVTSTVHVGAAAAFGGGPVVVASLTSSHAVDAPVTIDAALSGAAGGTPIVDYRTTFKTAGGTFAASCPTSAPFVTATFSAPTNVTATVTATNESGVSSSAVLPFTVSSLPKGAHVTALNTGSAAAVMSTSCSGTAPAGAPAGTGAAHSLNAQANFCRLTSYEIDAGLVDAQSEGGCYLQGDASIVPAAEWALLRDDTIGVQSFENASQAPNVSTASAAQAADQVSDTFYVFKGPAMVNGLDIEPAAGATVVLAVGGTTTGFKHQNAAYLVSSNASIYVNLPLAGHNKFKVPLNFTGGTLGDALSGGASDIGSSLEQAGSNAIQQLADSNGKSTGIVPPHVGGPVSLDVGAVQYVPAPPDNIETVRPHSSEVVSKFDIASALAPLKPSGLPFTISGSVKPSFDIAANGVPETTLANVVLGVPGILGSGQSGNLTGAVSVHADNPHDGAYLNCAGLSIGSTSDSTDNPPTLAGIPIKNLAVTYYGVAGADLPGCVGTPAVTTHPADSLVVNGDVVLLGGDITGRFELDTGKVAPKASSWHAVLSYNNPAGLDLAVGSPVPVFLSSATLTLDDAKLSGTVDLFAGAPGLGGNGCGLIGYTGQVNLQWKPYFVLDGTGASNVLCAPFGESDAFVVEDVPDGTQNVVTVAIKHGEGFDIPGLLNVSGSGAAGVSFGLTPPELNGFEADLDGTADLELPSLPFLGGGSTPTLSLQGSAQFVASQVGMAACLSVSASDTAGQGVGDLVTQVTGSSDVGSFVGSVFQAVTAPVSSVNLQVGAGFKYFGLPDAIVTTGLAVSGPGLPIIAARMLLGNDIDIGGCDLSNYQGLDLSSLPAVGTASSTRLTTRAASDAGDAIDVKPGEAQLVVTADGRGGAPAPVLTTPDGKIHIDTGVPAGHYGPILIIHQNSTTEIDIADPKVGRWTLGVAPGSTPITSLAAGQVVPPPTARGRVSRARKGPGEILHYTLANVAPGTHLAFAEQGANGASIPIATVTATARLSGVLRFTPAVMGAGRRTIVLTPTPPGVNPGPTIPVTTYLAPASPLGAPTHVHAKRIGKTVRVTFRPGANASGGDIAVIDLASGGTRSATAAAGRRSITVTGIGAGGVVAITVRGIRGNAYGPAAVLIAHRRHRRGH